MVNWKGGSTRGLMQVLSYHVRGGTEKTTKISVWIACASAEIRTQGPL
jgi:hypothetical protein